MNKHQLGACVQLTPMIYRRKGCAEREFCYIIPAQKKPCWQKRNHSLELHSSVFLKIVSNIQSGSLRGNRTESGWLRGASHGLPRSTYCVPLGEILFYFFTLTSSLQESTVLVLWYSDVSYGDTKGLWYITWYIMVTTLVPLVQSLQCLCPNKNLVITWLLAKY